MKKYVMTSNTYFAYKKICIYYGVALVVEEKEQLEVLEEYNNLTNNELQVKHFVKLCDELNLQQLDFHNVIEDFVTSVGEY